MLVAAITIEPSGEDAVRAEALSPQLRHFLETQALSHVGSFEIDASRMPDPASQVWSDELFHIHARDRACGPIPWASYVERAVHPDEREAMRAAFVELVSSACARSLVYRVLTDADAHSDGDDFVCRSARYVQMDVRSVARPHGGLDRIVGTVRDVTAQKILEEKLRLASEQAIEASRIKSQFLANMSHEIRTPMNGVLGMTSLVLETRLDAEQREFLEAVQQCGESLLAIINDILDLSKVEAGKLEVETIPFSLRESVELPLRPLVMRAKDKGVRVLVDVADDLGDRWLGDPVRMRQIVTNLVGNAVKFTERGSVTVEACGVAEGGIHLVVTDTGPGIPLDRAARLFEPFTQADETTTRRYGGTGLGLSICKQLVELMGGRVWLDTEVGRGSSFHVVLPLRPAEEVEGTLQHQRPPSVGKLAVPFSALPPTGPRGRILLAEDHPVNARFATRLLERRGFEVRHVISGDRAVAASAEEHFDVVLMDVMMPTLDGIEATEQIRSRERRSGGRVPIIALTASAMKGDRDRCLEVGMDDYLDKPIVEAKLLAAIERYAPCVTKVVAPRAAPVPPEATAPEIVDWRDLRARCGDDAEFVQEVVALFLGETPAMLQALARAHEAGDGGAVHAAAHRLKGSLLAIGAVRAAEAALAIELSARACDVASVGELLGRLEREVVEVTTELRAAQPASAVAV